MAGDQTEDEGEDAKEPTNPIPMLETGQRLDVARGKLLEKKTKPPARYTEATLVKKLESRLESLREGNKDRLLTFEEMGVDDLTVDESHEFKNLAYNSRLDGVSGMGNKAGS